MDRLLSGIREIPDFPKPGILFKDITPLLQDAEAFQVAIRSMAERLPRHIEKVVAIESRGFIFGSALAFAMNAGLALVRKPRKLPYKTERVSYALEYGEDSLEMHIDALSRGERAVIVDDVLATGGTALAAAELVEKVGGKVESFIFLSELAFLNGREKLKRYTVHSLLTL